MAADPSWNFCALAQRVRQDSQHRGLRARSAGGGSCDPCCSAGYSHNRGESECYAFSACQFAGTGSNNSFVACVLQVGFVGLSIVILVTACNGITEEHEVQLLYRSVFVLCQRF